MKRFLRYVLAALPLAVLTPAARAQALVYCVAGSSTPCSSSAQLGSGTIGDPLWKAFGKINDNFSNPSWLSPLGLPLSLPGLFVTGTNGGTSSISIYINGTNPCTPSTGNACTSIYVGAVMDPGASGTVRTMEGLHVNPTFNGNANYNYAGSTQFPMITARAQFGANFAANSGIGSAAVPIPGVFSDFNPDWVAPNAPFFNSFQYYGSTGAPCNDGITGTGACSVFNGNISWSGSAGAAGTLYNRILVAQVPSGHTAGTHNQAIYITGNGNGGATENEAIYSDSTAPSILLGSLAVKSLVNSARGIDVTAPPYNAVCDGSTDDSTAINSAITAANVSGGVVLFPAGLTCATASPLNILSNVTISGYGATLKYSGATYALSAAATGTTNFPVINGLTIALSNAAAGALHLSSIYKGTFRDITINGTSVGTTNTAILMDTNTTGTVNPAGNLNTAMNYLVNISLDIQVGTAIKLQGTNPSPVVTDNTIANFKTMLGAVAVAGIDFNQWADSNDVIGMTRIKLTSVSPANGACLVFSDGGGGIYSENIGHVACDVFASPATDNRTGMIANANVVKQCYIEQLQYGPTTTNYGAYDLTGVKIVAADWISSVVNVASTGTSNVTTAYDHRNVILAPEAGVPFIISGNPNVDTVQINVGVNSHVIDGFAATGAAASILLRGNGGSSVNGLDLRQDGANLDTLRTVAGLAVYDGTTQPTGSAQGGGTLNTLGLYVNGVPVLAPARGTPFTVTGCGSASAISGDGIGGKFTCGTGASPATIVVTMNGATGSTAANLWVCSGSDTTTAVALPQSGASSTTTCTMKGNIATSDVVTFEASAH